MEETLSTIQLDFLLPERFDLTYVGEDGENTHRPVVIHRGIVSTMERFVAYLTEVYKGAFPTWLAPIKQRSFLFQSMHTAIMLMRSKNVFNHKVYVWKWTIAMKKWATKFAHHKCKNSLSVSCRRPRSQRCNCQYSSLRQQRNER